ncbi:hypothetical protein ACJMK2_029285 [Sinanodonta woodiana]|uniref:Uncharacterized protein n=1 Tax=Sinanodonta woodiana TaxID=1069815 RepID=A0ABD3X9P3_SINWO
MSQFESALDDYRRHHPQITVGDKINGTGRRRITEKGPDDVTHICAVHENRETEARARLKEKYQRRRLQRYQPLLDILADTINQYRVDVIDGGNFIYMEQ